MIKVKLELLQSYLIKNGLLEYPKGYDALERVERNRALSSTLKGKVEKFQKV
jgi:hypothetical protein